MNNLRKKKRLIRKLFKVMVKETIGPHSSIPIKLKIIDERGHSTCRTFFNWRGKHIIILLGLSGIETDIKHAPAA